MCIDVADTEANQCFFGYQLLDLSVARGDSPWQVTKHRQDDVALPHAAHCQLTDDERMHQHPVSI